MPPIEYDARTLVPDLTQSLQLAMGIAQQRKAENEKKRNDAELAGLQDQLPAAGGMDAMLTPENVKIVQRMARLNPQAAQLAIGLAKERDQSKLTHASQESEKASRVYQALLDIKDPAERNKFLGSTIRDMEQNGADTSKLRELIGLTPDQQTLKARAGVILAGDMKALADRANDALMAQLKVQGQQLENMHTAQQMQLAQSEERRKAQEATTKAQEAAAKTADKTKQQQEQQTNLVSQASTINTLIDDALALTGSASTGLTGSVASTLSPTGATAQLARKLDTLKANVGLDKLLQLKANGGNLGALSEKELAALQNVVGSLDYRQDPEELRPTLERLRAAYSQVSQANGGGALAPRQPAEGTPTKIGRFLMTMGQVTP